MRKFSFEKLDVWQLSRKLTVKVYKISKEFPEEEKYGLTSQIRRAVISVSSNIAEGTSRQSGIEQARVYRNLIRKIIRSIKPINTCIRFGVYYC